MGEEIPQSVADMMEVNSHVPTAPLGEFVAAYREDDNLWWMISCGHHLNLFEAALERIEDLEERLGWR